SKLARDISRIGSRSVTIGEGVVQDLCQLFRQPAPRNKADVFVGKLGVLEVFGPLESIRDEAYRAGRHAFTNPPEEVKGLFVREVDELNGHSSPSFSSRGCTSPPGCFSFASSLSPSRRHLAAQVPSRVDLEAERAGDCPP